MFLLFPPKLSISYVMIMTKGTIYTVSTRVSNIKEAVLGLSFLDRDYFVQQMAMSMIMP